MGLRLDHEGISVEMPGGFEGRVFRRAPTAGGTTWAVAHFATFPLPVKVSDFGGGAVELLGPHDVFAVLFEYGPESVGAPLFSHACMPRRLHPGHFRPYVLRKGIGHHSGTQWFFTESGRPFTLYAVIGSHARRSTLVPRLNTLLGRITIAPRELAVADHYLVESDPGYAETNPAGMELS